MRIVIDPLRCFALFLDVLEVAEFVTSKQISQRRFAVDTFICPDNQLLEQLPPQTSDLIVTKECSSKCIFLMITSVMLILSATARVYDQALLLSYRSLPPCRRERKSRKKRPHLCSLHS